MSRYRTSRGWNLSHVGRKLDLSKRLTICSHCGRINPHIPPDPATYRTPGGLIDPLAFNRWTTPLTCAGCGAALPAGDDD
jgi:hypothetical protein